MKQDLITQIRNEVKRKNKQNKIEKTQQKAEMNKQKLLRFSEKLCNNIWFGRSI